MSLRQLGLIAIAAMVLIGGVAAVGAASPADQANDNATDAYAENAPEEDADNDAPVDADDNASEDADDVAPEEADSVDEESERAGNATSVGPSDGLPEQVPVHVTEIHETIESYLDGSIDDLGQALSDLLGDNGAAANADSENASNAEA